MLGGVLVEGAAVVVEVERLARLDGLAGVEQQSHPALVAETQRSHVLELGLAVDALVLVVYAQEESRDVAVLLRNDVQALGRSCGTDQEEDAVVFLEVYSDPSSFDLSDVFGDDGERFDVLRGYEVETLEPVLFHLKGTYIALMSVDLELLVGPFILLV